MTSLSEFWQAIDGMHSMDDSFAQWRIRLGERFIDYSSLLSLQPKRASCIPHPTKANRFVSIVEHSHEHFVGIDDWTNESVPVSREDRLVYRIDAIRIGQLIAEAIELDFAKSMKTEIPFCFRVGSLRPLAGLEFPVYLGLVPNPYGRATTVCELALHENAPFVLCVPKRSSISSIDLAVIEKHRSLVLPLDECIDTDTEGSGVLTERGSEMISYFLDSHVPRSKSDKSKVYFQTARNASWLDLTIRFIDGETVQATVMQHSQILHYVDMGMANSRNAKPTKQWELLVAFAHNYGQITWTNAGSGKGVKKQTQMLSKKLIEFFRIDGAPIEYLSSTKGYKTAFRIEADL